MIEPGFVVAAWLFFFNTSLPPVPFATMHACTIAKAQMQEVPSMGPENWIICVETGALNDA